MEQELTRALQGGKGETAIRAGEIEAIHEKAHCSPLEESEAFSLIEAMMAAGFLINTKKEGMNLSSLLASSDTPLKGGIMRSALPTLIEKGIAKSLPAVHIARKMGKRAVMLFKFARLTNDS